GLRGKLGFDRLRTREGESVLARLRVRTLAPWDALGLAVELGPASERAAHVAETGLATVPGWRSAEVSWSYVPAHRGLHPIGPARLTCGFPFGLWHAARGVTVEKELLVWPRTFPVGPVPEAAGERSQEG